MYNKESHSVFSLKYHIVLVTKYRKKTIMCDLEKYLKQLILEISKKHNVNIIIMESDIDHIHMMVETKPTINLSNFIKTLKSYTNYHMFREYESLLRNYYFHKNTFWSAGYFICSIGNASEDTIRNYIKNQKYK